MTSFRLQLRQLRQERTLSQEDLAKALGVSRQSIISLEHGEYQPSFQILMELIRFFDCDLTALVQGVESGNQLITNNPEKGGEKKMRITPWHPFQILDHMRDEMAETLERNFTRGDWSQALGPVIGAVNVHESDAEYELEIQVPGYQEDEINVEFSEDTLTVSGIHKKEPEVAKTKSLVRREWEKSEFSRMIRFAHPVKPSAAEAKLENGTLSIVVPKVEPVKPKTTRVSIKKK